MKQLIISKAQCKNYVGKSVAFFMAGDFLWSLLIFESHMMDGSCRQQHKGDIWAFLPMDIYLRFEHVCLLRNSQQQIKKQTFGALL